MSTSVICHKSSSIDVFKAIHASSFIIPSCNVHPCDFSRPSMSCPAISVHPPWVTTVYFAKTADSIEMPFGGGSGGPSE